MLRRSLLILFATVLSLSFVTSSSAQPVAGTELYGINLETGEATLVGQVGEGEAVIGLAFPTDAPAADLAIALTIENDLIEFSVNDPANLTNIAPIAGLGDGETLVGMDFRPATGELFAMSDASIIYVIDLETVTAVPVGEPFDPPLESQLVGFDFNPTVDLIRVITDTGQNLRVNPDSGQVNVDDDSGELQVDGRLAYAAGDPNEGAPASGVAAGYTNNFADAEETELFVIDSGLDVLALQEPPNDGVLNTVGPLGVDATGWTALDVAPSGEAFALIPVEMEMPDTGTGTAASSSALPMVLMATAGVALTGAAAFGFRSQLTRR